MLWGLHSGLLALSLVGSNLLPGPTALTVSRTPIPGWLPMSQFLLLRWVCSFYLSSGSPYIWVPSCRSAPVPSLRLQRLSCIMGPTHSCLLKLCGEMAQCLKCNPEPRVQISRTHISLDTLVHVSMISVPQQEERRQRYEESPNLRASSPGDGNKTKTLFQTRGKVEYWGIKLSSELLVCLWTHTGAHTR